MNSTIDRKLEDSFKAVLSSPEVRVYRSVEPAEQIRPCAIISARVTGEELSFKLDGRVASAIELRVSGRVSVSAEHCEQTLENFARMLKLGVETATGLTGWNFLLLEYQGNERAFEGTYREFTHIWNVTAHHSEV